MTREMTCGEFSDRLNGYMTGKTGPEESKEMEAHLASCPLCRDIYGMKKALEADRTGVPAEVERELVERVISDVAAARESGRRGGSWTRRFLMPAMTAAIFVFVFLTGFMLGEIRGLRKEARELRGEVSAIEAAVYGGSPRPAGGGGGGIFGGFAGVRRASGSLTVGEASRLLRALPEGTEVLTGAEAERILAGDKRLRRLAGRLDGKPWKDGLTSGELLFFIMTLELDPDTRIPDEWDIGTSDIIDKTEDI
jgi:hypothetical protein